MKVRHTVSKISVTVEGNEASAVSYVQVPSPGDPTPAILFSGSTWTNSSSSMDVGVSGSGRFALTSPKPGSFATDELSGVARAAPHLGFSGPDGLTPFDVRASLA